MFQHSDQLVRGILVKGSQLYDYSYRSVGRGLICMIILRFY